MSLKLLIDMNLSVEWVDEFTKEGYSAIHWSAVGDFHADDTVIMQWAKANGYTVFTHDLDFGTLLALTKASAPSVLQVRGRNVLPEHIGAIVLSTIKQYKNDLINGALVVVDIKKARVRILPIAS